jgi:hypothetical protein
VTASQQLGDTPAPDESRSAGDENRSIRIAHDLRTISQPGGAVQLDQPSLGKSAFAGRALWRSK